MAERAESENKGWWSERSRSVPEHPSRILVCDDEHLVAAGLSSSLSELGYEVVGPAHDSEAAIGCCRDEVPDLVIMDIRMPGRDGLSAADYLFHEMRVPVIVVSAYSKSEYAEGGAKAGVFGYLLKPVTQDQLRVSISVAWGRYIDHLAQNGEIAALRQRLADRKLIEQAKWVIVKVKNVSEPEAMKLLQRQARNSRRQLADVSREVVDNETILAGEEWDWQPRMKQPGSDS
jgi:response regulator NasT